MKTDDLKKQIKATLNELNFVNLGSVLLGAFLIFFSSLAQEMICRGVGVVLTVWGIIKIIEYVRINRTELFGSFALVKGCAFLGIGLYILLVPEVISKMLIPLLGVFLFIAAVLKIQYALEFSRYNSQAKWAQVCCGIIMVVSSVIAIANPFQAANVLLVFLGIALVVNGVWDFISIFMLSRYLNGKKKARQKASKEKPVQKFVETQAEDVDKDD